MVEKKRKKAGRPNVFGFANNQCVWSKAGVVKSMMCINAFDCLGCAFDQKVQADFQARENAPEVQGLRFARLEWVCWKVRGNAGTC